MNFSQLRGAVRLGWKRNNTVILSATAGIGVLGTAYLTARATFKAAEAIAAEEQGEPHEQRKERLKERTKLVWKFYIPPAFAGGATIGCIVGSNRLATTRIVAAQTALAITEQAYANYRRKIVDEFGERKDETIRADVVSDKLKANPPPSAESMIITQGNVLMCELWTDRFFSSDKQHIMHAVNRLNEKLNRDGVCTLNDFYEWVGTQHLRYTTNSGQGGWLIDRGLLELKWSAVETPDGRPALCFDYNYVEPL